MTTIASFNPPVKFGRAADAADLQRLTERYGKSAVRSDLVFSYAAPPSKGFPFLTVKAADSYELQRDAESLKASVKSTPAQDVYLVLTQARPKEKAIRKQVTKTFVKSFNKPPKGLLNRAMSMLAGIKLRGEDMEIIPALDKTIVRIPFSKSSMGQMGDLMGKVVDAVEQELNKPANKPQKPQPGQGWLRSGN